MKRAMTKKRNRPEEILAKFGGTDKALPQGKSLQDVAISFGVYMITLHRWRTEYGSADRDAVKRLKELERENGRPKRLVVDQALDIQILKDLSKGEFVTRPYGVGSSNTSQFSSLSCNDEHVA